MTPSSASILLLHLRIYEALYCVNMGAENAAAIVLLGDSALAFDGLAVPPADSVVPLARFISNSFASVAQRIDCVQLGKSYGDDVAWFQVWRSTHKLSLTRFGVAISVLPDHQTGQCREISTGTANAIQGQKLIKTLLNDMVAIEQRSKDDAELLPSDDNETIAVYDPENLQGLRLALNDGVESVVSKRMKYIPVGAIESW